MSSDEPLSKAELQLIDKIIGAVGLAKFRTTLWRKVRQAFGFSFHGTNIEYGFARATPDERSLAYLEDRIFILSDKMQAKLVGDLRWELLEGVRLSESIDKIKRRLDTIFEGNTVNTERIARTEVLNAQNAGRQSAYEESEVTHYKMWRAAMKNPRTAADSKRLHGQIQEVGNPFVDPKTGDAFMHPPNRPNCRCTLIPMRKLPENVVHKGGQMYAADEMVGKIEIDMGSLIKTEKRIWIKPTSKRKGHYRKVKGVKKEVDKISERIDKILLIEDSQDKFGSLYYLSSQGHTIDIAKKIVNNETLSSDSRGDITANIIAVDKSEDRDNALFIMYKDNSPYVRYMVAKNISGQYLPNLFGDSDFGVSDLAKKRHEEWLGGSKYMRSPAAKECGLISDEFIETGEFNPGKATEKMVRDFDGYDIDITKTLNASIDSLYRGTVYESFHGKSRDNWIKTSNEEYGGILKNVISKLYGGEIYHHDLIGLDEFDTVSDEWLVDIKDSDGVTKEEIEKYVDLQHKLTTQLLEIKYPGQDEFVAYRGTTLREVDIIGGDKEVNIKQNPISSWTLSENIARSFADKENGVVIKTKVKREDIWSCFLTHNHGTGFEQEIVVIGNKKRIGEII